jgi:hypothetical protein
MGFESSHQGVEVPTAVYGISPPHTHTHTQFKLNTKLRYSSVVDPHWFGFYTEIGSSILDQAGTD